MTEVFSTISVRLSTCAIACVLALALYGCDNEQRAQLDLPHQYQTDDPEFLHSMGALLGRGIVSGNRVTALNTGVFASQM